MRTEGARFEKQAACITLLAERKSAHYVRTIVLPVRRKRLTPGSFDSSRC